MFTNDLGPLIGLLWIIVYCKWIDITLVFENWQWLWTPSADALSSEAVTVCCILAVAAEIIGHSVFFEDKQFIKWWSFCNLFFQTQCGFFCVWKNLQEFICIPLKKVSGSRHFASKLVKLLFLLRKGLWTDIQRDNLEARKLCLHCCVVTILWCLFWGDHWTIVALVCLCCVNLLRCCNASCCLSHEPKGFCSETFELNPCIQFHSHVRSN